MIYLMQNRIWTLRKITVNQILTVFKKNWKLTISFNSIWCIVWISTVRMRGAMATLISLEKFHLRLNWNFIQYLQIIRFKNTLENVDWILLKMTYQSYLIKSVLIIHNKCPQADIAHNSVSRSHPEQHSRTN